MYDFVYKDDYNDPRLRRCDGHYVTTARLIDPHGGCRLFSPSCDGMTKQKKEIMIFDTFDTRQTNWDIKKIGNGKRFVVDNVSHNNCTSLRVTKNITAIGIIGKKIDINININNTDIDGNGNTNTKSDKCDDDSDTCTLSDEVIFNHVFQDSKGSAVTKRELAIRNRHVREKSSENNDKLLYNMHRDYRNIDLKGNPHVIEKEHPRDNRLPLRAPVSKRSKDKDANDIRRFVYDVEWDQCVLNIKKMNNNNDINDINDNEWMFCIDTAIGQKYNKNVTTPLKLESGFEYIICMEYYRCECIRYPIETQKTGIYLSVSCNFA